MSTKSTVTTEVSLNVTEVTTSSQSIDAAASKKCIVATAPNEIKSVKREYSIVGDAFYAGMNSDTAPAWLTNLIDGVVGASVANGLTNYNSLVQDVRSAIDAIDVAENTFVEQIGFTALVDGIIGTHLTTLNVTLDQKFAQIVDLDIVRVDSASALATRATDLQAEFTTEINSRITTVQTAFANADGSIATDVTELTTSFGNQESNLAGTATAVTGLQTYVGLDAAGNPNGFGLLSQISTLAGQTDGVIDYWFYESFADIGGATSEVSALDIIDNAWTTDALKQAANGDVVYFKDTENAFWYSSTTGLWAAITDTSIYESLKNAADAQASADGKISSFYAWGDMPGGTGPADYTLAAPAAKYKTNAGGDYVNAIDQVVTDPSLYVTVAAVAPGTVSSANVSMWFNGGVLYKRVLGAAWSTKVAVPTAVSSVSYIAQGDLLSVFDPVTGDVSNYWRNGSAWVRTKEAGITSKSKWFVDLDNAVMGADGHLAKAVSNLSVTSSAYTDTQTATVESKFSYNSTLFLNGKYYNSGFGLDATGVTQTADGDTPQTAFDSEFWINAERLVLKSPQYPTISAVFEVTATGIRLKLANTEATKNEPKGTHVVANAYDKGDIVLSSGSSYIARVAVPTGQAITNGTYWEVLTERGLQGTPGVSYTGTEEFYKLTNSATTPTVASGSWLTTPQSPTSGNRYLWNYNKNTKSDASFTNSPVSLITQFVSDGYSPVKGTDYDDGVAGNNVRLEYSANGTTGWTVTFVPGTHLYIRSAVDTNGNGTYVGGVAAKFIPEEGVEYTVADGTSAYLHVKYSDNGTTFTATGGETLGTWIGTLSDSTIADSTTFGDYSWQKYIGDNGYSPIKGTDYDDGVAGNNVRMEYSVDGSAGWTVNFVPGTHLYIRSAVDTNGNGTYVGGAAAKFIPEEGVEYTVTNGVSSYIHIKYSDNGTSFTASNGEVVGTWIGTLVDTTIADSTTFSAYTWKLFVGADGASGRGITGIAETYQRSSSATTAPAGTWQTTFAAAEALTDSLPFMWNRTIVSFSATPTSETTYTLIAAKGIDGGAGNNGSNGSGSYVFLTSDTKVISEGKTTTQRNADFLASSGRAAQQYDVIEYINQNATVGYSIRYLRGVTDWSGFVFRIDGSLLITGTVVADSIVAENIIGETASGAASTLTTTTVVENSEVDVASITVVSRPYSRMISFPPIYFESFGSTAREVQVSIYEDTVIRHQLTTDIRAVGSSASHPKTFSIPAGDTPVFKVTINGIGGGNAAIAFINAQSYVVTMFRDNGEVTITPL